MTNSLGCSDRVTHQRPNRQRPECISQIVTRNDFLPSEHIRQSCAKEHKTEALCESAKVAAHRYRANPERQDGDSKHTD